MNQIHYALITTLCANPNSDLYTDVYYPIIKYGVSCLNIERNDNPYFDAFSVQEVINRKIGVSIPQQIIFNAVKYLSARNDNIETIGSDKFKFMSWASEDVREIENEAACKDLLLEEVTGDYSKFLSDNGYTEEKNLHQLFVENTDEVLDAFECGEESKPLVDERYAILFTFLQQLKNNDYSKYKVVNDFFWASAIAAYLKRTKVDFGIKTNSVVTFYLDTPIVFALMGLDSQESESYAKELVEIIKNSQCIPYVSAMTVYEIEQIFKKILSLNGPRPGTSIAEGYYGKEYDIIDLINIRKSYKSDIKKLGVIVEDEEQYKIDDIIKKYATKGSVKKLTKFRSRIYAKGIIDEEIIDDDDLDESTKANNYKNDNDSKKVNYRDIHDIYLLDLVMSKNKGVVSDEKRKAYFVTRNTQLVQISSTEFNYEKSTSIHPSKVVKNLWMHSALLSVVQKSGLEEAMYRCISMNRTNAVVKIQQVIKCNKRHNNQTKEDIALILQNLVERSSDTIKHVDELVNSRDEKKQEKELYLALESAKKDSMKRLERQKENNNTIKTLETRIDGLVKHYEEIVKSVDKKQTQLAQQKDLAEKKFELSNNIRNYDKKIQELKEKIAELDKKKNSETTICSCKLRLLVESVFLLVLFAIAGFALYFLIDDYLIAAEKESFSWRDLLKSYLLDRDFYIFIITVASALITLFKCLEIKHYNKYLRECKEMRVKEWEENNKEYKSLCYDLEKIKELKQKEEQQLDELLLFVSISGMS